MAVVLLIFGVSIETGIAFRTEFRGAILVRIMGLMKACYVGSFLFIVGKSGPGLAIWAVLAMT